MVYAREPLQFFPLSASADHYRPKKSVLSSSRLSVRHFIGRRRKESKKKCFSPQNFKRLLPSVLSGNRSRSTEKVGLVSWMYNFFPLKRVQFLNSQTIKIALHARCRDENFHFVGWNYKKRETVRVKNKLFSRWLRASRCKKADFNNLGTA